MTLSLIVLCCCVLKIYTVLLLVFLLLWMDPLGAVLLLLPLASSLSAHEAALWVSDWGKSSAQQGE